MAAALNSLVVTALLLSAPSLLHSASVASEVWETGNATDCQPKIPPLVNPNASSVTLQTHQWIWIENLTAPDWAPRTQSGRMFYQTLRPGFVRQQRLLLLSLSDIIPFLPIDVNFVTNGDTLCASALTQFRNGSSGNLDRVNCSQICHDNVTSQGTRVNLPLVVVDDWANLTRYTEYLALDSVDPDSRASYTCTGLFKSQRMSNVPRLLSSEKRCPPGDECMFNYDTIVNVAYAGCKTDFTDYSWCVSDMDLCSYNINGDCPVCCRGDLCNRAVAQKAYQRWLGKSAPASTSSFWMLAVFSITFLCFKFFP